MSDHPTTMPAGKPMATLHFVWQDAKRSFSVPVPFGQRTLLDLLPAARVVAGQATGAALERVTAEGKEISCRAGCGACCRQLVAISVVEAQSLAEVVTAMPAERQAMIRERFATAVSRLELADLLNAGEPRGERALVAGDLGSRDANLQAVGRRYFALQIPCPFLENESCGIYEDRPLVCREYHVTTPAANCARLYQVSVDRVEPPVRMGEVMARTAHHVAGAEPFMIPLVLSLEWSDAHPTLREIHDGKVLFATMMAELTK